jgi:hypothetical protein
MSVQHVLLIFLDGVGLGEDDPRINPFARAHMPTLTALTNGQRWLRGIGRQNSAYSAFVPTDPRLGVHGRPQSASGQATILTGMNVPAAIGEHYGPRPHDAIRRIIDAHSIFSRVITCGGTAALLEGYPPPWHDAVSRGKRLLASYQYAAHTAGVRLFDRHDVARGDAMSMDWTGSSWHDYLGLTDAPRYTPYHAGEVMVGLAQRYAFSLFAHWHTDTLGHRGTVDEGVALLELFDQVMAGALAAWRADDGLIVITSDHGNMEDLSHGKHTENDVPTLIIGRDAARIADSISTLADIAPAVLRALDFAK